MRPPSPKPLVRIILLLIMITIMMIDQGNVNVTKNTTAAGGKPVDVNQEMLAVGWTNIFGSFVQAIPVTHSLSR